MIVAGAKGLAKELLEIFARRNELTNLYFFDNVSADAPEELFGRFQVLRTFDQVREIFKKSGDRSFALGLGNPMLRHKLANEFSKIGGTLTSVISPTAEIGTFGISIGAGSCILSGAVITSSVHIGRGCLINPNTTISHDSALGNFVELSPGVNVTGNCTIGDFSFIGSNAVVLPKIKIGKNVIVGAGAVVTRDVADNSLVAGVPAVVKKKIPPIEF
jgi:sugar O-acyltransferase (sialic acid O-acetyltransferase NeuD family)